MSVFQGVTALALLAGLLFLIHRARKGGKDAIRVKNLRNTLEKGKKRDEAWQNSDYNDIPGDPDGIAEWLREQRGNGESKKD